jgi:hypothetical protein
MDLEIFENMDAPDLRKYIQFLLWHYRVVDAFWYLKITERFDDSTADQLNEKVMNMPVKKCTGTNSPVLPGK